MNKKWYGWSGSILEVDLTDRTVQKRPFSERMAHQYLGQAGINARMLYERTSAATDPIVLLRLLSLESDRWREPWRPVQADSPSRSNRHLLEFSAIRIVAATGDPK